MLRRLLAASLLVLLLAAPASADDLFEIDERLVDAGYEDAYTESYPGEDGARVMVDFVSASSSKSAYEQEAAGLAELVWRHLEEEVQAVDVAPTSGVTWLSDDLPPAVSFTRDDLTERFGTRSAELDQPSEAFGEEDLYLDGFGVLLLLVPLAGLLVVCGLVVAVVLLAKRSAPVVLPFGYGPSYAPPAPPPPAAPPGYGQPPAGPWQPPAS